MWPIYNPGIFDNTTEDIVSYWRHLVKKPQNTYIACYLKVAPLLTEIHCLFTYSYCLCRLG